MNVVLDADVLIGALDAHDAHHAEARSRVTAWHAHGDLVRVSLVNLTEVLVAPAAEGRSLSRARAAIASLGVAIHPPDEPIGIDAARLCHAHPISLADAYCLATARRAGAALASFDGKVLRAARAERIAVA